MRRPAILAAGIAPLAALAIVVLGIGRDPPAPADGAASPALPSAVGARAPTTRSEETAGVAFAPVRPGEPLQFPRDHGAHPQFRTEWWYVTGWLDTREGPMGFQVTFFRTRTGADPANPSAFAPHQVLFAHAALSDPREGRLIHDQRIAREGFGLAQARVGDADVAIDDWRFWRTPDGRFHARITGQALGMTLRLTPTQPILLQGEAGFSRKGPRPDQASWYYSLPQLEVAGHVTRGGPPMRVTGRAWLDREWSSTLLDPRAVGWDWAGLNLPDGSALMAFQVRDQAGAALWAGGSHRSAAGELTVFAPDDVRFTALRRWRSPRTGGLYPVAQELSVRLPGGPRRLRLTPLMDDQELDSRASGGPVYWEGAVSAEGGVRGYLELTGYIAPLSL